MNQSIVLTDPARELAELCTTLRKLSEVRGEEFLAEHFKVSPWSREFFEVIFTIAERGDLVRRIISGLEIDADVRDELVGHVDAILQAFDATSMRSKWKDRGYSFLDAEYVGPLRAISSQVRQRVSYRKLSSEEIDGIFDEVETLREWLSEHQLAEQDFIRQALLEGLERFLFRLERLNWLGWGYTLDSLKEVVAAYMLLERKGIDPNKDPNSAAILQKVGAAMKSVYQKVGVAKDVTDTGDWLLKLYGAGALIYQSGPTIAGLLA